MRAGTTTFTGGLTVTVDKPALVQLQRERSGWNVVVQDPNHHADEARISASDDVRHILLPRTNQITVEVGLSLQPGTYMYNTQGPAVRFVPGQTVDVVNNGNGTSTLTVNLPDSLDASGYDYKEEFYAGMPAVVDVPFA